MHTVDKSFTLPHLVGTAGEKTRPKIERSSKRVKDVKEPTS